MVSQTFTFEVDYPKNCFFLGRLLIQNHGGVECYSVLSIGVWYCTVQWHSVVFIGVQWCSVLLSAIQLCLVVVLNGDEWCSVVFSDIQWCSSC